MKPAAGQRQTSAVAKSEIIPNLLIAVGDSRPPCNQVNVTSDVNGRITDIQFTRGRSVKAGTPLLQLFDAPEQGDLANFKAQHARGADLAGSRQATGRAPGRGRK
jgi:multidrug efflux pump subunit AcrA (membrane-fusion protein)